MASLIGYGLIGDIDRETEEQPTSHSVATGLPHDAGALRTPRRHLWESREDAPGEASRLKGPLGNLHFEYH